MTPHDITGLERVMHRQLKMYWEVQIFFLTSSLDGDEWLALLLPHLPPGKGGWVGPTVGLDSGEQIQFSDSLHFIHYTEKLTEIRISYVDKDTWHL
jgi:hypothetical protein